MRTTLMGLILGSWLVLLPSLGWSLEETEIPVKLEKAHQANSDDSPWFRMLAGLAVVGIMAAGSWVYVRRAKTSDRKSLLAPEIKVLSQHFLGPKRSLAIVRVAGESILIGVTDQNINLIKSLSLLDEDIPEKVPADFNSVFNSRIGSEDAVTPTKTVASSLQDEDEFSISGIKDVVTNRLKNMRSFQ